MYVCISAWYDQVVLAWAKAAGVCVVCISMWRDWASKGKGRGKGTGRGGVESGEWREWREWREWSVDRLESGEWRGKRGQEKRTQGYR